MRPGMYVGGRDPHPLLWELVANCVDIVLRGREMQVQVTIHPDGSVTVEDDGPGISLSLEKLMCEGHHTPTADGHAPHVHLTLRGLGVAVVGALSEWVEVRTRRGDKMVCQTFARGEPTSALTEEDEAPTFGTRVRFRPDPEWFGDFRWDPVAITKRLHELACLRPGLKCGFDAAPAAFSEGLDISGLVPRPGWGDPLHDEDCLIDAKDGTTTVRIAIRWYEPTGLDDCGVRSYCNVVETTEGQHLAGFERGVGETILRLTSSRFGRAWKQAYNKVAERMCAVVIVETLDPQYKSPIKNTPSNPALKEAVRGAVLEVLPGWLEARPKVLKGIV